MKEVIILRHQVLQDRFRCILVQGLLSHEMKIDYRGTIPMPTFARRPSTMSSLVPVEIPQSSLVGQQRQLISELQYDKVHYIILHMYVGKYDSKIKSPFIPLRFSIESNVVDQARGGG